MKIFIMVMFFFCGGMMSIAQTTTEKKVEIKNTKKKKLSFGEIQVENNTTAVYKTLEIKYTLSPLTSTKEIEIGGVTYKMFADRKSAITYYNSVKTEAKKKEVYYVTSLSAKTTEVFTFRVN